MKTLVHVLLFSVLNIAVAAQSTVIPFRATQQRTEQVFGQGGDIESEQSIQEIFVRNSEGWTYSSGEATDVIAGRVLGTVKIITLPHEGRTYVVHENFKTVVITSAPRQLPRQPSSPETKTYIGRTCLVLRAPQEGGELWVDKELGFPLYHRRETPLPGGKLRVRITRVTGLTIGQEPDRNLFATSFDGYTVTDNTRLPK